MRPDDPRAWDSVAEDYAAASEPITGPFGLDVLDRLGPGEGRRLLDVAAGTGGLALEAARRGCEVTASDFAPAMVSRIARRGAEEGLAKLTARVLDGQRLDLPDGSFDLACSVFGVMFFPDHRAGLRELRRVLAQGGQAGVVTWSTPDRMAHLAIWGEAMREGPAGGGDIDRPAAWRAMDSADGLAAELVAAGFRGVEVRPLRHAWTVAATDWKPSGGAGLPLFKTMLDRLEPGRRERVRARLAEILAERFGDGPATFPAEAWMGLGRA